MHVAVTAFGADRPGIAAAVTKILYEHGGNIEGSRMAILGGHFAMMLIVGLADDADPTALEAALAAPAKALDLIVAVRPVAETSAEHAHGVPWVVSVYGADRPGIVFKVSERLAAHRVNIIDLATRIVHGDPAVYVMIMEVTVPASTDQTALESELKTLAADLEVDLAFHPLDEATL